MVSGRASYCRALAAFDRSAILASLSDEVTIPVAVHDEPLRGKDTADRIFMGGKLAPDLQIVRLLARLGEHGDPGRANELLGAPTTTVEGWCRAHTGSSGRNDTQP
jgi:hypothetical protein